jgi:hypothetical protein
MLRTRRIQLGSLHTYFELFARYFIDLTPNVALIAAVSADSARNLYTDPNTEDTPTIVEVVEFKGGVDAVLELGPGRTLANNAREALPEAQVRSFDEFHGLPRVQACLAEQLA